MTPKINKIIFVLASCLLIAGFGCKKAIVNDIVKYDADNNRSKYILEFDKKGQLKKYSLLVNDTLRFFHTFQYSDTSLIYILYNSDSRNIGQRNFLIDSNNRAVKTNLDPKKDIDITYSSSGFLKTIPFTPEADPTAIFEIENDGKNIVSYKMSDRNFSLTYYDTLSTIGIPLNFDLLISRAYLYTDVFGKQNQNLIKEHTFKAAGDVIERKLQYKLNTDGSVAEIKIYTDFLPGDGSKPQYSIDIMTFEYIFE